MRSVRSVRSRQVSLCCTQFPSLPPMRHLLKVSGPPRPQGLTAGRPPTAARSRPTALARLACCYTACSYSLWLLLPPVAHWLPGRLAAAGAVAPGFPG